MRTDLHKHLLCAAGLTPLAALSGGCADTSDTRPNILFVIADDQSWPYASAYGCKTVSTPGFDYVAGHGALFNNAYVTSPGSSPSRASIRRKPLSVMPIARRIENSRRRSATR